MKTEHQSPGFYNYDCNNPNCYFCEKMNTTEPDLNNPVKPKNKEQVRSIRPKLIPVAKRYNAAHKGGKRNSDY